jgi:hypothetical protein
MNWKRILPWIMIIAGLALTVAIITPNFVRRAHQPSSNACVHNLRLIDAAKDQLQLDNNLPSGTSVTMDQIQRYLGRSPEGVVPTCPERGTYSVNTLGQKPTCSLVEQDHVLP